MQVEYISLLVEWVGSDHLFGGSYQARGGQNISVWFQLRGRHCRPLLAESVTVDPTTVRPASWAARATALAKSSSAQTPSFPSRRSTSAPSPPPSLLDSSLSLAAASTLSSPSKRTSPPHSATPQFHSTSEFWNPIYKELQVVLLRSYLR